MLKHLLVKIFISIDVKNLSASWEGIHQLLVIQYKKLQLLAKDIFQDPNQQPAPEGDKEDLDLELEHSYEHH